MAGPANPEPENDPTGGVRDALDAFDRAFAAGDARAVAAQFSDDAQLLLHHSAPVVGRAAIEALWAPFFAAWDTSHWTTERQIADVHGDRAYTVNTYAETLHHRAGAQPSRSVAGRYVAFLRREADGAWRLTFLMNSHVRPIEELPRDA